jgi:hypothetical protein
MMRQDLYIEAIHHDDELAEAYVALGKALAAGESVTLRDGRRMHMSREELLAFK